MLAVGLKVHHPTFLSVLFGLVYLPEFIACFCKKVYFEASLDSIITPIKNCVTGNRTRERLLTNNLDNIMVHFVLEIDAPAPAVMEQVPAVIDQFNPKMDMHNQLLLERPTRLMYRCQVFEVLQELQVTDLPEALCQIILQYNSMWQSLLRGCGDGSSNRSILHRFSASQHVEVELKIEDSTEKDLSRPLLRRD